LKKKIPPVGQGSMLDFIPKADEKIWCEFCDTYVRIAQREEVEGRVFILLDCGHAGLLFNYRDLTRYHEEDVKSGKYVGRARARI